MHESLLEMLVEPTTLATLTLEGARGNGGRIEEGTLVSSATGRRYPIVRGIPRFVPDDSYAASFGLQWNRFTRTQLDSATGTDHSGRRFDAETGWRQDEIDGRRVLDAGCGAGRLAEIAAARGARLVALDYSSAVEAAARALEPFPNADLVQASLLDPPFRPQTFDFAYCIGVVQHTPDPPSVIANVVHLVRSVADSQPGGKFAFTIYARRPWTKLNAKYLVRPVTKRLPPETLLRLIQGAMPVLFPLTDVLFRVPVLGTLARFTIPVANYPEREGWTRAQRFEEAVLDTFDMLSPAFDSPMTWLEVEDALRAAGARRWEFKAQRPIVVVGEC